MALLLDRNPSDQRIDGHAFMVHPLESVRRESGRRQLGVHGVLAAHKPVESYSQPLLSGVNREVETRGHPNHIGHNGIGLDGAVAFQSIEEPRGFSVEHRWMT